MKEQLHDDNFEDFLREKINEFDGEPNSQMWDRIEGVIPPAPKPVLFKYLTPVSAAASVLLTLAVLAAVYQYRSNKNLNEQLKDATQTIETLENELQHNEIDEIDEIDEIETGKDEKVDNEITIPLKDAETLVDNNTSNNSLLNPNHQKSSDNQITNKRIVNNNSPKTDHSSNDSTANNNKKQNQTKSSTTDNNKSSSSQDDQPTTPNSNKLPSKPLLNDINKTPIANQSNNGQSQPNIDEEIKETPNIIDLKNLLASKNTPDVAFNDYFWDLDSIKSEGPGDRDHLMYSLFVQPLRTKASLTERPGITPPGGNRPFRNHKARSSNGWSAGVTLGYQINKNWSIHGGLAYQSNKLDMEFNTRIQYRKIYEGPLSPNGQQIYRRPYLVISPFGDMELDIDLRKNPNDEIPENAPMMVQTSGVHEITNLSVPFYIQAQRAKGAIRTGIKFGITQQYVLSNEFRIENIEAYIELPNGGVGSVFTDRPSTVIAQPQLNRNAIIDGLLGLVFTYKIVPDAELSLEPTVLFNIGNKYSSEYGSTHLVTSGVQLNYKYHF